MFFARASLVLTNYHFQWSEMEITKMRESNLPMLSMLYLDVRKATFSWLNTDNYLLSDFERDTEGESIYVAMDGEKILGFISIWDADNFIHHLYVSTNAQDQNIGSKLIDFAISLNPKPLSLKCMAKNERAILFYEKNGFAKENKVMDSSGGYYLMSI